ncbi:ubiquinol oxidase subunit II [Pelomonas sp. KK5]|uniref:ubiquinol oxidase subunit II n=1 Tax=Pelomonas sp. KK5 TaxID=1855730 RepID=UPI0009F88BFA|nr:ubiquinol oxidase subunit II [Pelomonas sp. KK5]
MKTLRSLMLSLLPVVLLAGCNTVVLNPSGDIASQQAKLVVQSTVLMLLIVVPVIVLTLWFAWKFRASNKAADYRPDWDHSTQLELIIWAAPLLIIIALGALTWISTHTMDPYRGLKRIDAQRKVAADTKPLVVEVVALDWKWLFIYPEQGIALVNEVAAPVDRPIQFKLTASNVMNAFYVPELAGMVYAMPGMQTQLHAVSNKPGNFEGFSSNYSGAGFSHMKFRFLSLSDADFAAWVEKNKAAGGAGQLSRGEYLKLAQPSEKEPVRRYASVEPGLYDAIYNRCAEPNKMCQKDMMAIDASGGLGGAPGIYNLAKLDEATLRKLGISELRTDKGRTYVAALCTPANPGGITPTAQTVSANEEPAARQ